MTISVYCKRLTEKIDMNMNIMSEKLVERIHFHSNEKYLFTVAGATGVSMLTGLYATGRNIQTLVDRDQHRQSIGLNSATSRICWLGIGGSVIGIVSGDAIVAAAKTVKAAATVQLARQIAIKSVAVSSCVHNGLAVSKGIANIIDKAVNEKEITALDVFQFTSAVLFFTHSVISTHQAMSLIKSIGKNSSEGSSDCIRAFMKRMSEFVEPTESFTNLQTTRPPKETDIEPDVVNMQRSC